MSLSLSHSNRTVTVTFFASGDELALEGAVLALEGAVLALEGAVPGAFCSEKRQNFKKQVQKSGAFDTLYSY